uniref:G-protein coupled receptors family 1 profile domain-containing protein n=1 Tax=Oncorhynchus tshawytscha TaxID=74940 RepID=A0AAZ3Q389_ONCTS
MLKNITGDMGNGSFSCHHFSFEAFCCFGVLWSSAVTIVGTVGNPACVDSYLHLRWRGGVFSLLLFLSNSVSIITLYLIKASRYLLVPWPALAHLRVSSLQVCTCSFHRTRGRPYTTVLLFFYFFIGLGCVVLLFLLIYRRVRVAARAPRGSGVGSGVATSQSCELNSQGELPQYKGGEVKGNPGKAPSSHSTWGSALTSHSAHLAGGQEPPPLPLALRSTLLLLPLSLSCNNPVLYTVLNRQFGQTYQALLARATTPLTHLWNH